MRRYEIFPTKIETIYFNATKLIRKCLLDEIAPLTSKFISAKFHYTAKFSNSKVHAKHPDKIVNTVTSAIRLGIFYNCVINTWRLSVNPVPTDRVVDWTSVSVNPDRCVLYRAVRVINYELLKHAINVLICDDRQRWISFRTKLPRFIPTQHWTTSVETIVLTVHRVTFGHLDCVYEDRRYVTYTNGST